MSTFSIGDNIGHWTILSDLFKDKKGIFRLKCQCKCGKISDVRHYHLFNGYTTSCGCINTKGRFVFKGIGDLSASYITSFKSSRRCKGIYFDENLTLHYFWKLYTDQNGKCALSGIPIFLNREWSKQNKGFKTSIIQTASIDRIDNTKGYEIGNIQWVHKDINYMRGGLSIKDFVNFCRQVASFDRHTEYEKVQAISKRKYFKGK